jgi:hypothetical protein
MEKRVAAAEQGRADRQCPREQDSEQAAFDAFLPTADLLQAPTNVEPAQTASTAWLRPSMTCFGQLLGCEQGDLGQPDPADLNSLFVEYPTPSAAANGELSDDPDLMVKAVDTGRMVEVAVSPIAVLLAPEWVATSTEDIEEAGEDTEATADTGLEINGVEKQHTEQCDGRLVALPTSDPRESGRQNAEFQMGDVRGESEFTSWRGGAFKDTPGSVGGPAPVASNSVQELAFASAKKTDNINLPVRGQSPQSERALSGLEMAPSVMPAPVRGGDAQPGAIGTANIAYQQLDVEQALSEAKVDVVRSETHLPPPAAISIVSQIGASIGAEVRRIVAARPFTAATEVASPLIKSLELHLEPRDLGPVIVRMSISDASLRISLKVRGNALASQIEASRNELARALMDTGCNLEELIVQSVTPRSDAVSSGSSHGQGSPSASQDGLSAAQSGFGQSGEESGRWQSGRGGSKSQERHGADNEKTPLEQRSGIYL